jgi:hypothetical protein
MALLRKRSPEPATPARVNCATNYDDVLRRTEQQKTLAREMIKRAQQMIDSALSMRSEAALSFCRSISQAISGV